MSVSNTNRKSGPYTCNGVTVSFPFDFTVFANSDVLAVLADSNGNESPLVLGTDYTVTLNSDQDSNPGGTVVTTVAHATGYSVTLTSQVANLQPTVFTNAGGFYPAVLNKALDRLTVMVQQVAEQVGRAVKVGISSSATPDQLITALNTSAATAVAAANAAATSSASAGDSASGAAISASEAAASAATVTPIAQQITAATTKSTPVDADAVGLVDSADGGKLKKLTFANLKSWIIAQLQSLLTPTGEIALFGMATAPTGWLKCNGAAVSRTTYSALFAAIGTTWGAGDGSTTFNLPELRGEFLRCADDGRGVDTGRAVGSAQKGSLVTMDSGGAEVVQVFDNNAVPSKTNVGFDTGLASDYPSVGSVFLGPATGLSARFSQTDAGIGVARPRNVALMPCIKY